MNKSKLRKLIEAFDPSTGTSVDFAALDLEVERLKNALKDKIQAQTLDDVGNQLEKFKKKLDFKSLFEVINNLETALDGKIKEITNIVDREVGKVKSLFSSNREESTDQISSILENIDGLRQELKSLESEKNTEVVSLGSRWDELSKLSREGLVKIESHIEQKDKEVDRRVSDLDEEIEKLRREFNNRIGRISNTGHGGQANRNIMVGGNSSTLSRYTDINIKPGSNVTLTYVNNDNLKTTDLTIAATGGGAGTVRSIATTTVSSTVGAVASTDYVVIASQGVQVTLPTAVSNQNLYTVKNTSSSSVLVSTTGGQTIDDSSELVLATQYTSVDLISDNQNWKIT